MIKTLHTKLHYTLFLMLLSSQFLFSQTLEVNDFGIEVFNPERTGKIQQVDVSFSPGAAPTLTTVEVIEGYVVIEGDVILGTEKEIFGGRSAVINIASRKWPNSTIPYTIAAGYPEPNMIFAAINQITNSTNLCLVPRTTEANYVEFTNSSGCSSYVGMVGGKQIINVNPGCGVASTVHEVLHAAGHWHEQTRADRDNYVTINLNNVPTNRRHNFNKYTTGADIGSYDYGSIMHYGPFAFSTNGQPTIEVKSPPGNATTNFGQRVAMSPGDISAVNQIYTATPTCSDLVIPPNLSCRKLGTLTINGASVTIAGFEIENTGNGSIGAATAYFYYLVGNNANVFGSTAIPALAAGAVHTIGTTADLSALPDGTYQIGVWINAAKSPAEGTYRDNNFRWNAPLLTLPVPPSSCPTDRAALVALYNATNGASWTNTWDLNQPMSTWYGVTTDSDGCVTELNLDGNQLSGTIPGALGMLSKLKILSLKSNQLTGTIPSELGDLMNLEILSLHKNQLTGSLPAVALGSLQNLKELDLSVNTLSGTIPTILGNLTNLEILLLSSNQFTGTIPTEIGNLLNLQDLDLSGNQLTGSIPTVLGYLTNLERFVLSTNQLTGSIPATFSNLLSVKRLYLHDNQLTGSIPSELGSLTTLEQLWLFDNQLTGDIPSTLGNLSNLQLLWLQDNQLSGCFSSDLSTLCSVNYNFSNNSGLPGGGDFAAFCANGTGACPASNSCAHTDSLALVALYNATNGPNWTTTWDLNTPINNWYGITLNNDGCVIAVNLVRNSLVGTIPTEIGNLSKLKELDLGNNQLSGNIPITIGNLSNLEKLYLYNSQLTGGIPIEVGNLDNLIELLLSGNQLTGSIPAEIGNLFELEWFNLSNNKLSGTLPSELGNLDKVVTFGIENNDITGTIPLTIWTLSNLEQLHLGNNQLTGTIPTAIKNLISIKKLFLHENQLSGSIPSVIGDLLTLEWLYMDSNQLSGSIPTSIGNLTNLQRLSLHNNQLTSSIPLSLGNLSNLLWLHLHNNQLSGTIPSTLSNLSSLQVLWMHNNQLTGCFPQSLSALCSIIYNFTNNVNLPGGGDFAAFCANGTGGCTVSNNLIYVNHLATGNNDGTTWQNAYVDLQDALQNAPDDGQIWIAKGIYYPSSTKDKEASFIIPHSLSIYGGFAGTESSVDARDIMNNPTILSGDYDDNDVLTVNKNPLQIINLNNGENANRILYARPTTGGIAIIIDGLTVKGANNSNSGGGSAFIADVGTLNVTIRNSKFLNNSAIKAGAVLLGSVGGNLLTARFENNTFINNRSSASSSGKGGAVWAYGGNYDIEYTNCLFEENYSGGRGGAVTHDVGAIVSYYNCIFNENYAKSIGGATFENGTTQAAYYNCTFYKNADEQNAAAICNFNRLKIPLYNCIFYQNDGQDLRDYFSTSSSFMIQNCILDYNNFGEIQTGAVGAIDGGSNLYLTNPQFVDEGLGDFNLTATSLAINAGNNSLPLKMTDFTNSTNRIVDGTVDLGAYEYSGGGMNTDTCQNISLDFDGAGDFIKATNSPVSGNVDFTIEAWFLSEDADGRTGCSGNFDRLLGFGGTQDRFELGECTGEFTFYSNRTGLQYSGVNTLDGNWHHVAATKSGNNIEVFLDGVSVITTTATGTFNLGNTFRVGRWHGGVDSETWAGQIDEVRLWNFPRTLPAILQTKDKCLTGNETGLVTYYNFNQGIAGADNTSMINVSDLSPTGNHATFHGLDLTGTNSNFIAAAPFTSVCDAVCTPICNISLDFDGAGDFVKAANSPVSGNVDFTIEAWFLSEDADGRTGCSGNFDRLLGFGGTQDRFELGECAGEFTFYSNRTGLQSSNVNTLDGSWHHVAATKSGNTIEVFLDGVSVITTSFAGTFNLGNTFRVGRWHGGVDSETWAGQIDEIRLWNFPRTLSAIQQTKDGPLTGNETGLVTYYNFNQGVAGADNTNLTMVPDLSPTGNHATFHGFDLTGNNSNFIAAAPFSSCETNTDFVWPGDFNNDGIVNNTDVLFWGLAAGNTTGPIRPNASLDWAGQAASDWPNSVNNINNKYQDGDGNGVINIFDLQAVINNYEKTHPVSLSDYPITDGVTYRIEPMGYAGNGVLKYALFVELDGLPVSLHGVVSTIDFGDLPVSTASLDIINSSISPDQQIATYNAADNTLDIALTRTDKVNQLTNGPVVVINVVTTSVPIGTAILVQTRNGGKIVADGTYKTIGNTATYDTYSNTPPSSTNLLLAASIAHEQCDKLGGAELYIVGGVAPYTIQWSTGEVVAKVTNLPAATYSVAVTDANGLSANYIVKIEKQFVPIYDENGEIINCNPIGECLNNISLANNITSGIHQAVVSMTSNGPIPSGADVTFKAGESITLSAGFSVAAGASFLATIEDCTSNNLSDNPNKSVFKRVGTLKEGAFAPEKLTIQITPNPFRNQAIINYELPTSGFVQLTIANAQGQPVKLLQHQVYQEAGKHQVDFFADDLSKGLYFISLRTKDEMKTRKFILLE